jgi:PAS domain S-box-containing protein
MVVPEDDPLARWMRAHAQFAARATLDAVGDPADRALLERWLDALGAEVLIPLHGRERLLGWLFVGQRVAGNPFTLADIENLMPVAEHVSMALENALLYEEAAVQKALAETVLHSIPVGIVMADAAGVVRWFNRAAEGILGIASGNVLNLPAGRMGSRMADCLARCARGGTGDAPLTWVDPATGRSLAVTARPLASGGESRGAVAIIRDMTDEIRLRERQGKVEREAFWTELAAAISHEVRNPLVAISTFAQLLPERYGDEEFRGQFSELVSREIARLDRMIDEIDSFANPPELQFRALAVDEVLGKAVEAARSRLKENGVAVERVGGPALPQIIGDESALVDSFARLVVNALEAVRDAREPRVQVLSGRGRLGDGRDGVLVQVKDNGGGIPPAVGDKVFSPFCTTKARGIGLGLPIVKRTVTDHSGQVSIETGAGGTCVAVVLPSAAPAERKGNETDPGG